jgi:hypothetical protein
MTARTSNPRDLARADLIGLAAVSFSAGLLLMVAMNYFIRGDWLAWIFVGCVAVHLSAAAFLGRRALRRVL